MHTHAYNWALRCFRCGWNVWFVALRPFYTSAANVHHSDGVKLAQGDVFMLAHKVSVSSRRRDCMKCTRIYCFYPEQNMSSGFHCRNNKMKCIYWGGRKPHVTNCKTKWIRSESISGMCSAVQVPLRAQEWGTKITPGVFKSRGLNWVAAMIYSCCCVSHLIFYINTI